VYWDIPTGGSAHGIFACLPYENLHLYYLGLMKYLLHALYNLRQVPKSVTDWYRVRCGQHREDANYASSVSDEEGDGLDGGGRIGSIRGVQRV
jgi:hypothetical protein